MISTDITGGSGSGDANQVFNLLAVVANPDLYAEKVRTLMETIEENKKYIALVAPANEILDLREQSDKDREAIKAELENAKKTAAQIKAEAKAAAQVVNANAKSEAAKLLESAQQKQAESVALAAQAEALKAEAARKVDELNAAIKDAQAQAKAASKAKTDAQAEKAAAKAEREALMAKIDSFIGSLK